MTCRPALCDLRATVLAEPVGMRGGIAQPGAAELDGRFCDPPPEWPDRRRDPKLDPGTGVPPREIINDHLPDRFQRLISDPVPAHLMRPERPGRQLIGVKAARL